MTTAFNFDNAALGWLGQYADFPFQGQNARNIKATNSELRFQATGTDLTARLLVTATGTNYNQVSVDGGGFTNLAMSGLTINTWSDVAVFAGLADTQHTVILRHNTGTSTNVFYQQASTLSLTGAAPALAAYANIDHVYNAGSAPFTLNAKFEGGVVQNNTYNMIYPYAVSLAWGDCCVRFKSNATAISIWRYGSTSKWSLFQDGVELSQSAGLGDNVYGLSTLATGLSGTHEYEIVGTSTSQFTAPGQLAQVVLGGGTQLTSTYVNRPALVTMGDSIVAGSGTGDSAKSFGYKLARLLGYESWNRGISGRQVSPNSSTATGMSFEWVDAVPFASPREGVAYIILQIGHNDAINGTSQADFTAQFIQTLNALVAATPATTTILVTGILPTTTAPASTNRTAFNGYIQTAVSTVANARVIYVSTDTLWGTGGLAPTSTQINANTSDGTHPTDGGYNALVTLLSPNINAYSPPATGGGEGILGG